MDFSVTVTIHAPPEIVWEVMRNIEAWPEWTPTVRWIRRLDSGALAVGSRTRLRQPGLPPAVWCVTELEEGRSFTWMSRSPGVRVTARHELEPDEAGCRATLSLRFSGPLGKLAGRLTRGLNERYLGLESEGLKRRSEERAR